MDLYEEFAGLVDALSYECIDYAVCGGIAVAFHGYSRFTKDIDFLVREEDLARILSVVRGRGFILEGGRLRFGAGGPNQRDVYRVSKSDGPDLLTLDLVVVNPLLQAAWDSREEFEWKDRRVQVVSLDGLAQMKSLAGREQDLLDLKMLGMMPDDEEMGPQNEES